MGGCSQINCILNLLREALKTTHTYYHLISGVDLPIKNNAEMLQFFDKYNGVEFLEIAPNWTKNTTISERYQLHWLMQDKIGKKKNLLYVLSRVFTKMEKYSGYRRDKNEDVHFYGGPSWFSITEEAAKCILNHGDWAQKRFKNTICCDEIYAQTILGNSAFKNRILKSTGDDSKSTCMRFIRFDEESPFILDNDDFGDIVNSECLFARKFGTQTQKEKELVDRIYELYK